MSCKSMMMQGDQYSQPFNITIDGQPIDVSQYSVIEFVVGGLTKVWKSDDSGEVKYLNGLFLFPLTQEETLAFEGPQDVQVRVKTTDGTVYGQRAGNIPIQESDSEEIL